MKHRLVSHNLMLLAVFLALTSTALASSTWYVDGVNGSDNNNCKSPETACKTIGHAISLASSGDSIMVAAATYTENLTIGFSLKLIGAGATTTIIDGGGSQRYGGHNFSNAKSARRSFKGLTIRNGFAGDGVSANGVRHLQQRARLRSMTAPSAGMKVQGTSSTAEAAFTTRAR